MGVCSGTCHHSHNNLKLEGEDKPSEDDDAHRDFLEDMSLAYYEIDKSS